MWPIVWPRQSGRVTDQRDYTGTKVLFGPLDAKSLSEKELRRVQGGFDSDRVTTPSLEKQGQGKLSEPAAVENLAELLRRKAENGVSWSLPAPDRYALWHAWVGSYHGLARAMHGTVTDENIHL
jgi:hypothetical protein